MVDKDYIKRKSILKRMDYNKSRNLFCERKLLSNEASVETFFVYRLIANLGYEDHQIKTKESISVLNAAKGSKKYNYKPDYALSINGSIVIIIDAKSPNVDINNHIEQCANYCFLLNRKKKTVKYFLLSNGLKTVLYEWNKEYPLIELDFEDFYNGSEKYEELRSTISFINISKNHKTPEGGYIRLKKINKEEAQRLFLSCHRYIWNTEKRGPLSAFTEFIKLIFIKMLNDKILHDKHTDNVDYIQVPEIANTFSIKWIESREAELPNPVNDILFKNVLEIIEDDVEKNKKKTIFENGEKIELKPTTIKGVAKKLEKVDLFEIDEDLNGRLFETFLNATMRGEALGQYFTPRSIVLLGTYLADLQINENHIDKVIDGSCGSGGFLIEALTIMRNIIRENKSYSKQKKEEIIENLSNYSLYGIDAATEPNLAKIARINMYLHGDGGTHIYFADGLSKHPIVDKTDHTILRKETGDMINNIKEGSFDVVLTNPPFSMWYEDTNGTQMTVLKDYELIKRINTDNNRKRLRGSAMFIERYRDLLRPGGKLISVIDETVLGSDDYDYVREFIRKNFIIKAIISLHGDAFQMASARVKTALIYLQKKEYKDEEQPSIFMYSSIHLGVDDMPITTNSEKVAIARENAANEIKKIVEEFEKYKNGESGTWLVPPENLTNRLDVKSCVRLFGRYVNKWMEKGFEVKPLSEILEPKEDIINPSKDFPDKKFRILTITYLGRCKAEEIRYGRNINYSSMKIVREGDLVFSKYNTFNGAIGYITDEYEGALASGSYLVMRCDSMVDTLYLWAMLRSTEIRSDFLSSSTGMGRQTIKWKEICNVQVPFHKQEERKKIAEKILNSWKAEKKAEEYISSVFNELNKTFDVESEESIKRFTETKPPK